MNTPARVILAVLMLGGCATPLYQTSYRYEPPSDPAGVACVARCNETRADCAARCEAAFEACRQRIEPQVAARYDAALQRYADALDRYAAQLRHYELELWMNWASGPWGFGPGYYGPWPYGYGWPGAYPFAPPAPPVKPTREAIRAELEREQCRADCGCQSAYDDCFVACGGRRVVETRCIAHCPQQR
jgi:hypothetical protein